MAPQCRPNAAPMPPQCCPNAALMTSQWRPNAAPIPTQCCPNADLMPPNAVSQATKVTQIPPLNNLSQCNSKQLQYLEDCNANQMNNLEDCNANQMKNMEESNSSQQKSKEQLDFKKPVRFNSQVIDIDSEDNINETSTLVSDISDQFQETCPKLNTLFDIHENPLYKNKLPLTTFDISDLPVLCRDDILFQYILTVASLTVKFTFSKICGDNIKSNLFSRYLKGGSGVAAPTDVTETDGMITDIEIFENGCNMSRRKHEDYRTCLCDNCKHSAQLSNEWVEITISISSNQFVRNLLGKDIKCTVFSEKFNLTMTGTYLIADNKQSDVCQLKIVTCDPAVLEQKTEIKELLDMLTDLNIEANDDFHTFKDLDRIYISISYLHSSTRYVSVGEWKETYQDNSKQCLITYTPNLHPHDDGGPVIFIGYSDTSLFYYMERSETGVCLRFSKSDIVLKKITL
ncbi:hypothetical protein Btru_071857 [Bulinus truncatus]|nr:hypothetical protein Btru_071857 [Bulinus truncatus]